MYLQSRSSSGALAAVAFVLTLPLAPSGSGVAESPKWSPLVVTPSNVASFVTGDALTQGGWKGVYGVDGGVIANYGSNLPPYVTFGSFGIPFTWSDPTLDARALQKLYSPDRIASCWFSSGLFTLDLEVTDGAAHPVAMYCVDFDSTLRAQTVDVLDFSSGAVLDSRSLPGFSNGIWLVWNIRGHVTFRITQTGGANAVVSGLFFGPPSTLGVRAAVSNLVPARLAPAYGNMLTQILDLAALRIRQGQFGAAISLLRSFNSYVSRFPLSALDRSMLLGLSSDNGAILSGLDAGLKANWKMDEGAGFTTADSSGNGNTGTLSANGPTWTTGKLGNAIAFDANGNVLAPTFSWPTGGPVTVAFWNRVTSVQVIDSSAFSVGFLDNPNRFQAHVPWGDGRLYWDYGNIVGLGRIDIDYSPYLNAWTHVALVSAGQGGSFQAIYLNGTRVASLPWSDGPSVPLSGASLGAWAGNLHRGTLDEFRIYNRILSPAEIARLAGVP